MGNSFEDALSILALQHNRVPPLNNIVTPHAGYEAQMYAGRGREAATEWRGRRYIVHYSAGFGGHSVYTVYGRL